MPPLFPEFKKLELSDREAVEAYTKRFPPYSDFNFTSLWAWDTTEERALSILNGALVVRFTDYVDQKPFLSFLGGDDPKETVRALLAHALEHSLSPELRLVPEASIAEGNLTDVANAFEDRGSFDYVYSIPELTTFAGSKYETKRYLARRFRNAHPEARVEIVDLSNMEAQHHILNVIDYWRDHKLLKNEAVDLAVELKAIHRLFASADSHPLLATALFSGDAMLGFSIDEVLHDGYSICHFSKADTRRKGVYDFFMQEKAKHLETLGVEFMNYEQDLGFAPLQAAKSSFRPVHFIKKYVVRGHSEEESVIQPR